MTEFNGWVSYGLNSEDRYPTIGPQKTNQDIGSGEGTESSLVIAGRKPPLIFHVKCWCWLTNGLTVVHKLLNAWLLVVNGWLIVLLISWFLQWLGIPRAARGNVRSVAWIKPRWFEAEQNHALSHLVQYFGHHLDYNYCCLCATVVSLVYYFITPLVSLLLLAYDWSPRCYLYCYPKIVDLS